MTWFIENLLNEDSFNVIEMVKSLERNDVPYQLVKTIPFVHTYEDTCGQIPSFVYGSTVTLKAMKNMGYGHLVRIAPKEKELLDNIGDLYMNSDMKTLSFEDSIDYIENSEHEFFFVKPNTDLKSFDGTVTDRNRYKYFIENSMSLNNYDKSTDICVSTIKDIHKEWRIFVVNGEISTYSQYGQDRKIFKERSIDPGAFELAKCCIDIYSPSDMMVIDVALMRDGQYKIIEYNTINCSGLYSSDVDKLVTDINKYIGDLK